MAGHNGHGGRVGSAKKTIRTADVERAQAAYEAVLRGTPELRAALRPGGLVRLTGDVSVQGQVGKYDELGPCKTPPTDHPKALRKGAMLIMVKAERVDVKTDSGTLRKPCYTFLIMGNAKRCVIKALTLNEPC